jgi:tetratricopeptide (TPR) repeat protein
VTVTTANRVQLLVASMLLIYSASVPAQTEIDLLMPKPRDIIPEVSDGIYSKIENVGKLLDENDFDRALVEMQQLEKRSLNKYEKAAVWQMIGYVHGVLGNSGLAIEYLEKALAAQMLTQFAHQGVLYSLASLYSGEGEFQRAIDLLQRWFQYEDEPFADAYMLMGSWYAALSQYADALPFIKKAIALAEIPTESWYTLEVDIHFSLENYAEAIPVLKSMLAYWPRRPRYWNMLAAAYLQLDDEKAALDVMMTAYNNSLVTDSQRILALVGLNAAHDTPFTAGSILENEMIAGVVPEDLENLNILLHIWLNAREYAPAIATLEKIFAIENDGSWLLRAANIQAKSGDWRGAADNASRALDAGVDNPGNALMLQGMALAELGEFEEALVLFRQAAATGDAQERQIAAAWTRYAEEEIGYQQQVAAASGN